MFCNKTLSLSFLALLFFFSKAAADPLYVTITDAQTFMDPSDALFQMQLSDGTYWETESRWEPGEWAMMPFQARMESRDSWIVKQLWHIGDHLALISEMQNGYVRWKAINLDRNNAAAYIIEGWSTK